MDIWNQFRPIFIYNIRNLLYLLLLLDHLSLVLVDMLVFGKKLILYELFSKVYNYKFFINLYFRTGDNYAEWD